MLSNTIEDGDKTVQCLDTNEKLQLVRQMTETTNNLYYFDLQRQLWKDYFELGMKETQWAPQVSKSFAKQHYTCRSYGFPKYIVEERLQTIGRQFQRTINELQQYITQLEQNIEKWQPYIHPTILSNAINECVKGAQQRLRQEFDYKRKMLALDFSDRKLITKFYELQPNKEQHHTCRSYGFPKHVIEQRQKIITQQLQRTTNELHWYLTNLEQNVQQWQPYIDPSFLSGAINEKMLTLNSNDRHLITKFYELQPNEEQIDIAKQIWQTTFDILKTKEQEEILRKRIFLRRLPTTYDKMIDKSLDYIEPMLSNQVLDKDRRACLVSNYSKTITQYKFDLMTLNLDTLQNVIRGHQQILNDLQQKLLQYCHELMIQAIENRRKATHKRHETYLKHKLYTFFDEAPATSNE
ncbi:unnamed protein product [Rotaria sp. Silwood2]|nr:unnamed protein product [Rotaria sp. Silwood2]